MFSFEMTDVSVLTERKRQHNTKGMSQHLLPYNTFDFISSCCVNINFSADPFNNKTLPTRSDRTKYYADSTSSLD